MTTVTSDSRSLAIPCFALAPNCLMLAVVIFPHGSITVLTDAATLSQAHLIQPGRALRAEPQVRSSFRESLQLYMQLRVALQSSIPRTETAPTGGVNNAISRRKMVVGETHMPRCSASRAPTSPLAARPIASIHWRNLFVMRAYDWTSSGSRSVKIERGQSHVWQMYFRTVRSRRTRRPPQGTSATVR